MIRRAVQARLRVADGAWTIGDLHTLACVVLGAPAFLLLRQGNAAPLDPVLSSLFRVVDGVRMTTLNMIFSIEHTRRADEIVTADDLYARAEQRALFIDSTGVCAGPAHMIRALLAAVVDGTVPDDVHDRALPAQATDLLAQLPAAIDYTLYALQIWALAMATWIAMSRAYEAILAAAPDHPAAARLRTDWRVLERMQLTIPYDRDVHLEGYRDAYDRAWRTSRTAIGPASFTAAIAPIPHAAADSLAEIVATYQRAEQAILDQIAPLQAAINTLLARPTPTRPLTGRDLHAQYALSGHSAWFPYLLDTLAHALHTIQRT
jgi:hypothetical protein